VVNHRFSGQVVNQARLLTVPSSCPGRTASPAPRGVAEGSAAEDQDSHAHCVAQHLIDRNRIARLMLDGQLHSADELNEYYQRQEDD